ncbi:hypothetical protein CW735_04720 [Alteromonas sp. MB-3u-76]|nr:hypothetical protein CW735_04720 [Alteromonas sp. MB-3u-76]
MPLNNRLLINKQFYAVYHQYDHYWICSKHAFNRLSENNDKQQASRAENLLPLKLYGIKRAP